METKLLWICTPTCKFPSLCRHVQLTYITIIINFLWHFVYAVVCSVFIIARTTAKSVIFGIWNTILLISLYALVINFLQSPQRSSLPCSTLSPHMAHTIAFSSSFSVNSFRRAVRLELPFPLFVPILHVRASFGFFLCILARRFFSIIQCISQMLMQMVVFHSVVCLCIYV
jgi:hypothetical protein